jgi:hypothetical protein
VSCEKENKRDALNRKIEDKASAISLFEHAQGHSRESSSLSYDVDDEEAGESASDGMELNSYLEEPV